ncbi:MAG: FkbM family methyltransferase [Balneolaceae bacterium]
MLESLWGKLTKYLSTTWIYILYNKWFWKPKKGSLEEVIHRYTLNKKAVSFVQIGANDGYHNDPLYRFIRAFNWRGVLVEPQVHVFERLKGNHAGVEGLYFENAAISSDDLNLPFYSISFSNARWATGLSSFDKNHILQHIEKGYVQKWAAREGVETPENIDDWIHSTNVKSINFDSLIKKHSIENVDAIFLDCEGFDEKILCSIDIDKYSPCLIFFEYFHFTDESLIKLNNEFRKKGYSIIKDHMDVLAYKNAPQN